MKILNLRLLVFCSIAVAYSSCTAIDQSMREPNTRVNLVKQDFLLSEQVTAEAKTVKVFGIDWARLFTSKSGIIQESGSASINVAKIPVIGNYITDRTANYALYELMAKNPNYDVVFYPQYHSKVFKPVLGLGFITKITTIKATARLGRLNK